MAALFQLTIISLIIIVLYYKSRFYGLLALTTALCLSQFASIAPNLLFGILPPPRVPLYDMISYEKSMTWWHFGTNIYGISFFIGIGFGFLLESNIQITRSKSSILWIYSIIACPLIYSLHTSLYNSDNSVSLIYMYLWYSLGKTLFCVGVGWIYFACCSQRGGIKKKSTAIKQH